MSNESAQETCGCKVGKIIDEHFSEDINDTLYKRWIGNDEEEHSTRELEEYFNKQVLEQRLREAGVEVLDGEVSNLYRLLSGDTSKGMETQAHRKLERSGIDVEILMDDFVSHQTIYRHLTNCLDAEKDTSLTPEEQIQRERDRIARLQSKSEVVSEEVLDRLDKKDIISIGRHDVIVSYRVACEDCGTHRELTDIIQHGGCDCQK